MKKKITYLIVFAVLVIAWIITFFMRNEEQITTYCDKQCQIKKRYDEIAKESVILEKYKTQAWNDWTSFIRNYSWYKKTQREIKQKQNEINIYISKDSTPQGLEVMKNKILGLSEEVTPLQKLSWNDLWWSH